MNTAAAPDATPPSVAATADPGSGQPRPVDGSHSLQSGPLLIASAVLVLMQFMLVVDTTIVNVALPDVGRELGFSTAGLTWVITSYALVFGGFILLSGKIGATIGPRRALLLGAVVFVTASVAAGLAQNPGVLLTARAVQGLGAALAAPSVLVLLTAINPPGPRRARALALYILATGSGAASGLLLGGILTGAFGWRSVMFVNVPIGAIVVLGTLRFVSVIPGQRQSLDVGGAVTSTITMTGLVFGFTSAAADGWTSPLVLASLVVAGLSALALVVIERRHPHPVVPLSFFSTMRRAAPLLAMMAVPAGQLGFLYYTTLVTQRALGYTPLQTGLALLPFTAGLILTNQLTPRLLPRYGERVVGSTGMVGLVLGAAGMVFALTGPATIAVLLLPSALLGLGAGLTFAPATGVILNQAPPGEVGAAASLTQGLQQLGGALGLAILTTVVTIDNEARSGDLAVAFLATAAFPATALLLFSVWGRRVQPTGQL